MVLTVDEDGVLIDPGRTRLGMVGGGKRSSV